MNADINKWIMRGLVSIGLLTPILFVPSFAFPFQNGKVLWLLSAIILSLPWITQGLWCNTSWRQIRKDPLFISVTLMLLVWVISGSIGTDPLLSWQGTVKRPDGLVIWTLLYLWMLGTIHVFLTDTSFSKHTHSLLFFISGIVGLIATLEWFDVFSFGEIAHGGVIATLGNPNFLGATLLLPFFWSLSEQFNATDKKRTWFIGVSLLCLMGILLSESRGAYLGLGAGLIALTVNRLSSKRINLHSHWIGVSLTVLSAVFIGVIALAPEVLQELLGIAGNSGMTRSYYWQYAVNGWLTAPLLGVGFQNFHLIANELYEPALYSFHHFDVWPDRVHNQLLELLVTTGAIGAGLYIATWSHLLARTWKSPFLFAGLIAIGAQLLFSVDTITVMLIWVFVIAYTLTKDTQRVEHPSPTRSKAAMLFGGILSVLLILCILPRIHAYKNLQKEHLVETHFGTAHLAQVQASTTLGLLSEKTQGEQETHIEQARNGFMLNTNLHPLRAEYWYEWAVFEMELAALTGQSVSEYGIQATDHVNKLAPQRIEADVLRAGMHALDNEYAEALALLDKALTVSPVDVQGRLLRAQIYTQTNNLEAAIEDYYILIEDAWWHPDVQNEDLLLALIATFEQLGMYEYIPLTAERLVEINPTRKSEVETLIDSLGL